MKKAICFLAVCILLSCGIFGCGRTKHATVSAQSGPALPGVKIKVTDVSNDTKELFDVDALGLLWGSLEKSLKQRGMLWAEGAPGQPLRLEAHIVKYQKGNYFLRNVAPMWGKTQLVVRCNLIDGSRVAATVEVERSISIGSFTWDAYRKVFDSVATEALDQLLRRL